MHHKIELFVRTEIKSGLTKCTAAEQHMFMRMYSHKDLDKDINVVVDNMSTEKLDCALGQVERTVAKNGRTNYVELNNM